MPIDILMPALSPTMSEGNLAKWHKKEGDTIEAGDVIAEIETDKATMEVEAVEEGTIGKILVEAGAQNVAVNTPIAILLEEGEDKSALDGYTPSSDTAGEAVEKEDKASTPEAPSQDNEKKAQAATPSTGASSSGATASSGGKRIFASPLAKRIAEQNNIDLAQLKGSGPAGRIVKADVKKAIASGGTKPAPASAAAPASSGPGAKQVADGAGMTYREEPLSGMRKTIASRLTESKQAIPHFYLTVDCEIDNLLALRKQINDAGEGAYKVSVNDLVTKAVALALIKVPAANAMWNTTSTLFFDDADISVAVATPSGLITPIVKKAQEKSLVAISNEIKDLAARARDGKLAPHEYQGGTFTISNLGMYGIKDFSAIINPPQACILAVGAGEKVPAVVGDAIKVVTKMSMTLSVDHRVVDGAVGAEFIQVLKNLLENPAAMLAQ